MTNKIPIDEALRLADELKERFGGTVPTSQAAAELRRLHAENELLKKVARQALEALWKVQQEPVAWVSAEDRLPPLGVDVLTYDVANPVDGFDCEQRLSLDEWSTKYSVSHWMPIPAPPTEDAHGITKGKT